VIAAVVIASAGGARRRRSEETAVIAVVQALALAAGFLFSSLYGGFQSGITARLFGTILGITRGQVIELSIVSAFVVLVLVVIGRPLLLASVDPQVAQARGISVRALDLSFLVLLGLAAA
jgi:zinc/manganese transport system permease protein